MVYDFQPSFQVSCRTKILITVSKLEAGNFVVHSHHTFLFVILWVENLKRNGWCHKRTSLPCVQNLCSDSVSKMSRMFVVFKRK